MAIIALALLLSACNSAYHIRQTTSDPQEIESMPREVAMEAVLVFSKARATAGKGMCVLTEEGVANRERGEFVRYGRTCFRLAYQDHVAPGAQDGPAIVFTDLDAHATICGTEFTWAELAGSSPQYVDKTFKWIGAAVQSLGSTYCPQGE
ncbi:hypothetical protein [Desulfocurvus sp. DL9XJH121]